ncbi:hypothetical protein [Bradyrhizobium sp. SYSU BS000235]|uniref:hypothetical protein n=1 Tax=Bradyrhizobium sp. SYSU BS000235 TaxID=3411332 RepID=UPI003C771E18
MIDEIKTNNEMSRGARAKTLLDNELLNEAFTALEAAYIERWRATHIDDERGREQLFIAVNVVGKVRAHLAGVVANGHVAAKQLDELARDAERRKRFGIV